MAAAQPATIFIRIPPSSGAHVRFLVENGQHMYSAMDLFLVVSRQGVWGSRRDATTAAYRRVCEEMMHGPLPPGGGFGWSHLLCVKRAPNAGEAPEYWIPTHGVGAVMWHLLGNQTEVPQDKVQEWRNNIMGLLEWFSSENAPSPAASLPAFAGRQVALVDSDDKKDSRVTTEWQTLLVKVAKLAGVQVSEGMGADQQPLFHTSQLGRTLAKLLSIDPLARDEAIPGVISNRALAILRPEGEEKLVNMLHAIKVLFACSWGQIEMAARSTQPMQLCYGMQLTPGRLVAKVKDQVKERSEAAKVFPTKSKKGTGTAHGAFFDARARFEVFMATEALRMVLCMPKGRLVICLSLDARSLARVPWWNTLLGIFFPTTPVCNRKDNFHSFGLYDGKETASMLLAHAKVRRMCTCRVLMERLVLCRVYCTRCITLSLSLSLSLSLPLTHSHTYSLSHSLIQSLTHSLTHSLTYSLTLSLTYLLTLSLTHSLTYSLTHSLSHSLTCSLSHLLNHLLSHLLTHSLTLSLTHLLAHSLTYSLTYSLTHLLTYSLSLSLTHLLAHSLTYSLTYSLTHLLTHSLTYSLTYLRTHSLTYLLTHSLAHLLTLSLTYLLTLSLTHSLTHLLTLSLTYSLTYLLTHSLTYSLSHLLTHLLTYLLTHSLIYLLTLSLTHSLIYSLTLSLAYSLTHSLSHSLTYALTYLLTHLLSHSLTYSLSHLLTHLLTHSLTYLLTHSLTRSLPHLLTHSSTQSLTY
jgi:hypothetical protein